MKVSNNALNFLLAQYRAIFKRAYVKGLASAVLLTAGLAAGQAQATIVVNDVTQDGSTYFIPDSGANIVVEAGSSDSVNFGYTQGHSVLNNFTMTGGTLKGNHTDSVDRLSVTGTTTLSGVTAIVSGGDYLEGTNSAQNPWTGTLNLVDGTEMSVNGGAVNYNKINLEDGVNVTIGGTQYFDSTANNYYSSVGSVNVYGDNGSLNINTGATLTLTDNSAISILNGTTEHNALNLNGGTIVFDGSEFVDNFSGASTNKAAVIAGMSKGDLNFAAGSVQVNEGKYGEIRGTTINLNGATITNDGNLLISSRRSTKGTGEGTTTIDGSHIVNNAHLYFGEALTEHSTATVTVDAKRGTLDNAAGKVTTVASGATVNLNGITVNNAGIIDIDAGGAVNAVEQENEDLGTDGVVTLGGTINVGGTLTVGGNTNPTSAGTTLVIAEDAVLTSDTEFSTAAPQKAIISVQGGNTLQVSAAQLQRFLASGDQVDFDGDSAQAATADKAGGVSLTGTIDFGDSVTLSGFTFGNTDEYAAGKIAIGGTNAVAKATDVTLNKALTGTSAANLTVEADNLNVDILTNGDRIALEGDNWDLNFKSATVHKSLNLSAAGTDSVTLGNVYNLEAYTTSVGADGKTVYTPDSGTITGAAVVESGSAVNVNAGSWVANDQITVGNIGTGNAISVTVADQNDVAAHKFEIGSSLTLAGGLAFDLSTGNASVGVTNNSDLGQNAPLAELDLTAGISVTNATGANTAKINATSSNAQASVYMNERDVNAVLSSDTETNRNLNKVAINVAGQGGTLEVAGSVDADFTDFKSGSDAAGAINFNNGGNFVVDSLTLRGDSSTGEGATAINIGTGSITADSVNLVDEITPVTDEDGNDLTKVSITSGTLNVGSSLTSNAGNFTVSGASSTLNLEAGADTDQGLITSLDQITLAGGKATVTAGNWLAQVTDFDVQDGSSLTIGGETNADGTYKHASLSANDLKVGGTGAVSVEANGAATFTTLDASQAASGAIKVNNGTLTINGQAGDMDGDADTTEHGIYFGDRNSTAEVFRVTGSAGNLVFGEQASLTFFDQSHQSGAATNSGGTVIEALVDASAQEKLAVQDGGRVTMDFNGYSFSKEQVKDLKNKLFNGNFDRAGLLDGFFDIGDSTISGIEVVSGSISWDALADITDIVWDTTNTELGSAVVTDVTESSQIGGSYGAQRPDAGTTLVHIASNTSLGNAAANGGLFIGTAPTTDAEGNVTPGTPVDAVVHEGSVFSVTGAGTLADVTLMGSSSNSDLTTFAAEAASGDTINVGAVVGSSNGNTMFSTTGEGTFNIESIANVGEVVFNGTTNTVSGTVSAHNATFTGATVTSKDVTLDGDFTVNASNVVVDGALKLTSAGMTAIQHGSQVSVGDLSVAGGSLIRVGSSEFTAAEYEKIAAEYGTVVADDYIDNTRDTNTNSASTGVLEVTGETRLNGSTLFVDPEYGMSASVVALNTFAGSDTTAGLLGTLDGSVVVGKNAIVGTGFENAAALEQAVAKYRNANGSLNAAEVGSIFYVNGQLNVADGEQIILNGKASHDTVQEIEAEFAAETNAVAGADMYLGTNTAVIISDNALAAASRANANHDAAIEFNTAEAQIYAQTGAKVLIDGTSFSLRSMNLFDDAGSDGVALTTEDGKGITLESVNGLFSYVLEDGTGRGKDIQMSLQQSRLDRLSELSDPVRAAVVELATATVETVPVTPVEPNEPATEGGAEGGESKAAAATGNTVNRYDVASGTFLGTALTESLTGSELEQASRLAVYAGTAQAALAAATTTTDAIAGRMGMGAQQGNITFADNSQGAGIWLAPVYKNHDSDSFDAQGIDYGVDMDLYGVALGADYTLANGVRVGAMFNLGSGDAEGQGVGEGVNNDFDYYGFGVYGGYTVGQFSITADVSYTVADNEFDANTNFVSGNFGKIEGTADSTLWSIGVTAQYALDFNGVEIAPHAGLRYSSLEVDDYQVKSAGQSVASFDSESMSIFSIPVGVSISSDIAAGSWTIKPAIDLTLTANVGDDELDGTTTWYDTDNGYGDLSFGSSAEVLDTFTYGATVGVSAQTGGFSLGLGLNYTGASNANEYGVQANARFTF